jgi:hypothetical protein
MTRLITVTVVFAAAVCAQVTQKKSDRTATSSAAAPTPAAAVSPVPKDAVKNADGTWSYTDKQGKKWLYFTTPFGVMISPVADPQTVPAPAPPPAPAAPIKVIDKGDTVRFEQAGPMGPFGPTIWEKKKSELTDQERQMLEAQQNQNGNQSQTRTAKPEAK